MKITAISGWAIPTEWFSMQIGKYFMNIRYLVQINGKKRAEIQVPAEANKDEIEALAARRRSIKKGARPCHLAPGDGLAGSVGSVIGRAGEVEEEWFLGGGRTAEEFEGLPVKGGTNFPEDIGAVQLLAPAGGPHHAPIVNPARSPALLRRIGMPAVRAGGRVTPRNAVEEIKKLSEQILLELK
mgnify:CR=1 FL=1